MNAHRIPPSASEEAHNQDTSDKLLVDGESELTVVCDGAEESAVEGGGLCGKLARPCADDEGAAHDTGEEVSVEAALGGELVDVFGEGAAVDFGVVVLGLVDLGEDPAEGEAGVGERGGAAGRVLAELEEAPLVGELDVDGAAVVSAIFAADDIEAATRELSRIIEETLSI